MHIFKENIIFNISDSNIEGHLCIPEGSQSLVIFSHGSGSSRFSPRNNFIAEILNKAGISTFLPDLLTPEEDENEDNRFDIELLTSRLTEITTMILKHSKLKNFLTGYFGASTGAASALKASVGLNNCIKAIVSRGGRPDLVPEIFTQVTAPTLLIVGERDIEVLRLNDQVFQSLKCTKKLSIIPGATHLFEEAGTLEQVGKIACDWYKKHL